MKNSCVKKFVEKDGKYLFFPKRNDSAILRLYCFPYAGGDSQVFSPWLSYNNLLVELVFIRYPGRGSRLNDTLIDNCQEISERIACEINEGDKPCVLLGCSMGGSIAFDVARKLTKEPLAIHLCASCPPLKERARHLLDDVSFLREVKSIGGIDNRLLQDLDMRHFILKVMRNDFKLLDTYRPEITHIKSAIHVWVGNKDPYVTKEKALAWQTYCSQPIHLHNVEGGHFFIQDEDGKAIRLILSKVFELGYC